MKKKPANATMHVRREDKQSFAASKQLALRGLFSTVLHKLMTAKTRVHNAAIT